MRCPYCGKPIAVKIAKYAHSGLGPGWDYSVGHQYETPGPFSGPVSNDYGGPVEATRTAPARPASIESDVAVPLLQSLATGAAVLLPAIGATVYFEWPWFSPLVAGGATFTIAWLALLGAHRKLLWIVESVSNLIDIEPSAPPKQTVSLEVRHQEPSGRIGRMQFIDLPENVTQEQLIDWAKSVVNGVKTPARSNWAGSGKSFSRDSYDAFTKAIIEAGILAAIPGKGNRLTTGGRHALQSLINGEKNE